MSAGESKYLINVSFIDPSSLSGLNVLKQLLCAVL